jgi:asparagine synthase (glutamine-hydrolysing)
MCGIAGFIARKTLPVDAICAMTDLVRHRGPDDEGFLLLPELGGEFQVCGGSDTPEVLYRAELPFKPASHINTLGNQPVRLALGHRRLSIVDLSAAGHQPMCSADRRFWIVYNGEVYNHIELRDELAERGHQFRSHSDTEVILAAYQEWGTDCLSHFNGMFAFLLYDAHEKKLFAVRDRFGVKPLYYWISPDGDIAFASEIKQFTVLPGWRARINGQRAYDFLAWAITDHTDETMFRDVFQLRGGEMLQLDVQRIVAEHAPQLEQKKLEHTVWYNLIPTPFSGTMAEAAAEFRDKLVESVRLRLRADVPVGSCLSGGLDSSSIVCIMNRILEEQGAADLQKTFSACADVPRFDERSWIDIVVDATKVDAHFICPSLGGLFEESPDITWHQDEPFGSTSIYAQWNVFRLAAENGVKVMLDGQGADEQLAGYHSFFGVRLAQLLRSGQLGGMLSEISAMQRLHGYSLRSSAENLAHNVLPEWSKNILIRASGRTSFVEPQWLDCRKLGCQPRSPFVAAGVSTPSSIRDFSIAQLTVSCLQQLLHWEDRDSMAHSVESRVPFLDYRLVEFVVGLPDEFKLSDGITKKVLRAGMSDILPDRIRDRMDKLGFVTPEEVWMRERAPDLFRSKLADAVDVSDGIFGADEAFGVLEEMISGRQKFSFLPWRMINFGEWVKRFSVEIETDC